MILAISKNVFPPPPPKKKINKKILGRKEHHNNFFSASKKYHLKAINNELRRDYAYKGAGRGARWAGSGRLCEDPGGRTPTAIGPRTPDRLSRTRGHRRASPAVFSSCAESQGITLRVR